MSGRLMVRVQGTVGTHSIATGISEDEIMELLGIDISVFYVSESSCSRPSCDKRSVIIIGEEEKNCFAYWY